MSAARANSAALDAASLTFAALAHPARRAMLAQLLEGECTVSALAEPHAMSLPAVSQHLKLLEGAGLVTRRREGRTHRISLRREGMTPALDWIEEHRRFWELRLDGLEAFLAQQD